MKPLVLGALLCLVGTAQATVLAPLDTRALTSRADRIVLGTVESQAARWTDDHDAIYTDVTVRVSESYKGRLAPGQTLVVRRLGGEVDGVGMRVFGAASFAVGEEVVLFVEARGSASYPVGMTQGKLHVSRGPDGQKRVSANLAGVAFTRGTARIAAPRRLVDLEREIRSFVNP